MFKALTWVMVFNLVFGALPIHAAGICDTANFEGFFLAPDGKSTLAITKQQMTWTDAFNAAKVGGGQLVVITDVAQNSAIFSNLSSHFTVSPRPSTKQGTKAWIDLSDPLNSSVWSVEGGAPVVMPSRFSWADGFSSYANWAAGQPDGYCTNAEMAIQQDHNCYGEPWAAINNDGTWSDEGDHGPTPTTLKGVVEWPNTTLDCARVVIPVTTPIVAPVPDAGTGAQWCANQSKSTMAECTDTTDGKKLCPIDQVACNAVLDTPICPAPSSLNTNRHMCQVDAAVTCTLGGTALGLSCQQDVTLGCPAGYALSPDRTQCVTAPKCVQGQYNGVTNKCELPPQCSSGQYNAATNQCETLAAPASCGTTVVRKTYDNPLGPNNNPILTYDDLRTPDSLCNVLRTEGPQADPSLALATSSVAVSNSCLPYDETRVCDFKHNGSWGVSLCGSNGQDWCTSGVQSLVCEYTIPACTQRGTVTKTWTPPQGPNGNPLITYDDLRDPSWACGSLRSQGLASQIDVRLSSATSWSAPGNQCFSPSETIDQLCDYSHNGTWGTISCNGSGQQWCTNGVKSLTCQYDNVCLDPPAGGCAAVVTATQAATVTVSNPYCPTGNGLVTIDESGSPNDLCVTPIIESCPAGTSLNSTGDKCVGGAQITCPVDMGFNGDPVNKCESIPTCQHGLFIAASNACYNQLNTCPLGNFQCYQKVGDTTESSPGVAMTYCSVGTCQTDTSGWSTTNDTESGTNDKLNDGGHNADGSCNGTIYLYNGTDMRCRAKDLNGATAAWAKLAAEIALSCTGVGAALAGALAVSGAMATAVINAVITLAVNTAIDAATVGVDTSSLISNGIAAIAGAAGGAVTGPAAALGDTLADGVASGAISVGADSLASPALSDAIQAVGNTVSQYSPAISQGMLGSYSTTKCCYPDKLSSSCLANEIQEAKNRGNGLCHVVGKYCSSKMLSLCMVEKETSCCFTSKLGRIFHEQGRPGLTSFGEDGGWGTPRSPVCRGFTPEEFQNLNFGAMDLTEYEQDMEAKMNQVQPILQNYMNSIGQSRSQQLQNTTTVGATQ